MIARTSSDVRRATWGGALSGVAAGAVLTVMMTAMSVAHDKDIWYGMKGAAAPFLGARAMLPGFDGGAVALGLASHFAISAAWGVPFALLFWHLSRSFTLLAGLAWGFVVWVGMYYVVLPTVGLAAMANDAPVVRAVMFHLFFSLSLAAAFLGFERVEERHAKRTAQHAHA